MDVPVGVIIGPSADLASLANYVEAERASGGRRPTFAKVHGAGATSIAAGDLTLDKFLDTADLRAAASAAPATDQVSTVLLTGANGYLGRFLALEWLQRLSGSGGRLIVLLRGDDAESARRRLERAFETGDASFAQPFPGAGRRASRCRARRHRRTAAGARRRELAAAGPRCRSGRASGCVGQPCAALRTDVRAQRRRHSRGHPAGDQRADQTGELSVHRRGGLRRAGLRRRRRHPRGQPPTADRRRIRERIRQQQVGRRGVAA